MPNGTNVGNAILGPETHKRDCHINAVGKRRDGGTRYWCQKHKADATAKYGRPASFCRYAHVEQISPRDIFQLNIDDYQQLALWGAVPPVYDTTRLALDRGIHVHSRANATSPKIDKTYRCVRLTGRRLPTEGVLIPNLDAIYYMVTSIFGYKMKHVVCPLCGYSHLDRDWFSVHPHRRHLCSGCGRYFSDSDTAVGNPICKLEEFLGQRQNTIRLAKQSIKISQKDFPGGIQIWGSNPAFLWTGERSEREGIHLHALNSDGSEAKNETYSEVEIDGIRLDPIMVRTLMAQKSLPHLRGRVSSISCTDCHRVYFSKGTAAFTPALEHKCSGCRRSFKSSGRLRKLIGNPLPDILKKLAINAPRTPQNHVLDLIPETI